MYHSLKFSSQLGWVAQHLQVCKAAAKKCRDLQAAGVSSCHPCPVTSLASPVTSERRARHPDPVMGLTHCAQGLFETQLHTQSLLSCCHMALILVKFDML